MSKKILDAAITAAFCACLIMAPNIQEKEENHEQGSLEVFAACRMKKPETAVAGVFEELFEHSFTTESGEETAIERNEVVLVTSQEENIESHTDFKNTIPVRAKVAREVPVIKNRWNITLTADEIDLLARIVWLEANGEPVQGQQAVVEVIFNRMASDLYPNTLYDVLSQKNPVQFCSWKNRNRAVPTDKEYQSIHQVLDGNTSILRNDTLYFSTKPLTANTDIRIGGHSFCY